MLPQEIFEKRKALRSILVNFWPCITCIIISVSGLLYYYDTDIIMVFRSRDFLKKANLLFL